MGSLEYIMEQWNTLLSGSSACATDKRTLITFASNVLIAIFFGLGFTSKNQAAEYIPVLVLGVLALRSKVNWMGERYFFNTE
jgi:hypothetical protein